MSDNYTAPIAVLGNRTTHGGKIITATAGLTIDGRNVARVGDKVMCPEHGEVFITDGGAATIEGRRLARHGSMTSCGATIIVDDGGPSL